MPPITIGVPGKQAESALQLVVNYAAPARDVHFEVGKATRIEFELDGTKAFGGNAAARFLASLSPSADRLLGETPEEAAQVRGGECGRLGWEPLRCGGRLLPVQVTQWLTFGHTELSPLLDDKLAHVNDWLSTRTYLAGHTLTLADLAVYAAVHAFVVSKTRRAARPVCGGVNLVLAGLTRRPTCCAVRLPGCAARALLQPAALVRLDPPHGRPGCPLPGAPVREAPAGSAGASSAATA